jgi:hypothetical protein
MEKIIRVLKALDGAAFFGVLHGLAGGGVKTGPDHSGFGHMLAPWLGFKFGNVRRLGFVTLAEGNPVIGQQQAVGTNFQLLGVRECGKKASRRFFIRKAFELCQFTTKLQSRPDVVLGDAGIVFQDLGP